MVEAHLSSVCSEVGGEAGRVEGVQDDGGKPEHEEDAASVGRAGHFVRP